MCLCACVGVRGDGGGVEGGRKKERASGRRGENGEEVIERHVYRWERGGVSEASCRRDGIGQDGQDKRLRD